LRLHAFWFDIAQAEVLVHDETQGRFVPLDEEQARRLEQRIDNPRKNWKISHADIAERNDWDEYMAAYEDALTECSTEQAPWYVIPANKKWFRNLAVSQILVDAMMSWKMTYPPPAADLSELRAGLRAQK